jgi:ATP-dependent RNA helicase RhlB
MSEHHLTQTTFASLGLPESLLAGVRDAGFEFCTPIQAETLPIALEGRDIAGQAQTGTGKTAAFLLATFNYLRKQDELASASPGAAETSQPVGNTEPQAEEPAAAARPRSAPRAVILAPTRELAVQIHKDAVTLARHTGYRLVLVFGGTGYDQQRRDLEAGVDVLIGTPGRIIDYNKQGVFDLRSVQVMVLDEADRMFDLGFIKDIRFLLRRMPEPARRLNMLFSATLSYRVTELAYEHMNNPTFVRIEPDKRTADKVTQVLYHTAMEEKLPLLVGLIRRANITRSVVFINTKDMAENVADTLKANGINAAVLSGDVPQTTRLKLMQDFIDGNLAVLVATDVAARGLHIPEVSHVFNFDLPQNAEDYVHRIGRTARAGASGDAISFACEKYVFGLPEIEAYIGHKIPTAQITPELLPPIETVARRRRERDDRRPGHGRDRDRGRDRGGRPRHDNRAPRPREAVPREERPPRAEPETPVSETPLAAPLAETPAAPPRAARQPPPAPKSSIRRASRETPAVG